MMRGCCLVMALCLLPVSAMALEPGMVWDVTHRCFRSAAADPSTGCGLTWHVDARNYSGEIAKSDLPEAGKDVGARLDAQMAAEQQQVDSLRKNENVEKVRAVLSKDNAPEAVK